MKYWKIAVMAVMALSSTNFALAEEIKVYNWADYFGTDTIKNFTKETGIKVIYDTYDAVESMETKMLIGQAGYDFIIAAATSTHRFTKPDLLLKLDKSKLTNMGNLDPAIMKVAGELDPENKYTVPYTWGTVGIAYNKAKIKERMKNAPVDSLDMFFKPDIIKKFADCGIAILDSPTEVLNMALHYLGLDPHSGKKSDIKKAQKLISKIRPNIKYFNSMKPIDDLATGEICLALMYNGDANSAAEAARKAKNGIDIAYSIPKEGTLIWIDVMSIPVDAKNVDGAHKLINYLLRPDVIASLTNTIFYANANSAADNLIDPEIKADPNTYPPESVLKQLFADIPLSKKAARLRTRAWTKIKTGF